MTHPPAGMNGPVAVRLDQARMIVQRLERLSADSSWAHIASGYRGSFLRMVDSLEAMPDVEQVSSAQRAQLDFLIDKGFELLANAAREIGDPELIRFVSQMRTRLGK